MKDLKNEILSIILICMFFSSCSKKTSPANFSCVPKDVGFVSVTNLSNLAKKVKLERLKELNFFKKIEKKKNKWFKQIYLDPSSSGIAFNKDVLFFSLNKRRNKDFVFTCSLKGWS